MPSKNKYLHVKKEFLLPRKIKSRYLLKIYSVCNYINFYLYLLSLCKLGSLL